MEHVLSVRLLLRLLSEDPALLASDVDREKAEALGSATWAAERGESGRMMALVLESNSPYRYSIISVPLADVANREKLVPQDWIPDPTNLSPQMREYLSPLIGGPQLSYEHL